jgi:hypothetical protein
MHGVAGCIETPVVARSIIVTMARGPSKGTFDQATHDLVDELARVLSEERLARVVLSRAGFPTTMIPTFTTALVFWDEVLRAAGHGAVPGGIRGIIDVVARQYPGNAVFARQPKADATTDVAEGVAESATEPAAESATEPSDEPTMAPPAEPAPATSDSEGQPSAWFFVVGAVAFIAALVFAIWGFGIGDLTDDRRQILRWIFSIAAGFAAGAFAGGLTVRLANNIAWGLAASATGGPAVWLITFSSLFLPRAPPMSESRDLLVMFEDSDGRPVRVDGEFVVVVESEEYRCDPRGRVSCRIPSIPVEGKPRELIVRLEGSSHEIIHGPYAFEPDGNVTIVVGRVQGSPPEPTADEAPAATKPDDKAEKPPTAGKKPERVQESPAPVKDEPSVVEHLEACVVHIDAHGGMLGGSECSSAIVDAVSMLRITQLAAGQDLVLRNTNDKKTSSIADQGRKTIKIGPTVLCMRHTWTNDKRSSFKFSMTEGGCR